MTSTIAAWTSAYQSYDGGHTIITAKIVFRQIEAVSTESRECYLLKGRSRTSRNFCVCVELAPIMIIIIITLYLLSAFLVSGSARAKPTWTQS
jgi:hypothetical protein